MIALIIFGTKGVTSTLSTGSFNCPGCSSQTHYDHKRVRKYFTLYWLPIFPGYLALHDLGEDPPPVGQGGLPWLSCRGSTRAASFRSAPCPRA